jgi:hypothetical protein|nr:MAG TPA: SecA preprotein cross-linking domain [Caudoviricetes sp.]
MKNIDLFDKDKNYVYGEYLVTIIDEFTGIIAVNGEEVVLLPSDCKDLGYKVDEFEQGKTYVFDKRLIPDFGELAGWEKEIDGKLVYFESNRYGICYNDFNEAYAVSPKWCKQYIK